MRQHVRRATTTILVMLVLVVLASTGLTAALLFPFMESGHRTPQSVGIAFEPLSLTTSNGTILRGWFMANPASHGRTVLVLHGISANKSIFLDRGADVQRLGYNVAMLDLRHHGDSSGSMTTYGFDESVEVESAIDQLEQRPDVRRGGVVVVGYSLGGAVALQTLGSANVRGVVADSAFSDLHSIMAYRGGQWHVPAFMQPLCEWEVSMVGAFHVDQVSPLRCLASSQKPVLIIQGAMDMSVPVVMGRALAAAGDPHVLYWEVPGTGHVAACDTHHEDYLQHLRTFLKAAF